MKAKIYTKEIMDYVYEQNGWLYWKKLCSSACRQKIGSLAGNFQKSSGYYHVKINGKTYYNHRILYQIYNNVILSENDIVDHHDRNKTNNSKENLVLSDHSENSCNQKVNKNNLSTGLKNISIMKSKNFKYYHITIRKHGKQVFSKYYRTDKFTEEDVIKIRDEQLKIHHGGFMSKG